MKAFFVSCVVLFLAGCSDPTLDIRSSLIIEPHCSTPEERQALASFIIECGRAVNSHSDEEGEDLIAQCEKTGERALCPEHRHKNSVGWINNEFYMTDTVEVESFVQPHKQEQEKVP